MGQVIIADWQAVVGADDFMGKYTKQYYNRIWANAFYASAEWKRCRRDFIGARGGLCERCLANGTITPGAHVHHKIRLTPQNIKDPSITLSWDNLELLCEECHREEHSHIQWRTDEFGHVDLESKE